MCLCGSGVDGTIDKAKVTDVSAFESAHYHLHDLMWEVCESRRHGGVIGYLGHKMMLIEVEDGRSSSWQTTTGTIVLWGWCCDSRAEAR
jgi:hypothetical protein